MMKQIRKFEQEAIVNQIMEGVNERLDSKIDKAKKSKEYKALVKMHDSVSKLQSSIDRMVEAKNEEVQILNEQIKKFNDFHTVENVGVSTIDYNNQELSWWRHDWQTRTQVADKLAVALIEDNAQERIKEIIVAIANEVS
jgi:regulator of sirC expression with transglutaminase-like and TPR domain